MLGKTVVANIYLLPSIGRLLNIHPVSVDWLVVVTFIKPSMKVRNQTLVNWTWWTWMDIVDMDMDMLDIVPQGGWWVRSEYFSVVNMVKFNGEYFSGMNIFIFSGVDIFSLLYFQWENICYREYLTMTTRTTSKSSKIRYLHCSLCLLYKPFSHQSFP